MAQPSAQPVGIEALIEAFSDPNAYPHPVPGGVELIQTHISLVFLAGERVYKFKKPLDLGFLDYSTLEARRACCEAEVSLNRRLAPSVYLQVEAVTRGPDGALRLGGEGEPLDYAVVMRRLPAERTFKALVAAGALTPDHMRQLAELLARFHRDAARDARIASFGSFEVVATNCRENFTQLAPYVGATIHPSVLRRLEHLSEAELEAQRSRIAARVAAQIPCDSHGDLRLEHVYALDDALVVVDCIEFNERFRYGDPLADLAFPVMELDRAGRHDLARALVDAYFAASGDHGRALLELYVAYRAVVRGKIRSFMTSEDELPEQQRLAAVQRARGHFLYALGVLGRPEQRPCLLLIGGLPASGKSTLARGLEAHGFTWIRSDAVRKELAGLQPEDSARDELDAGIYTAEWTQRTYDACLERAREALFAGLRVVVDASFQRDADRLRFFELARAWGLRCGFLVCHVDAEATRARLERRRAEGDASDADWAVYQQMAARWEPTSPRLTEVTVQIDTRGTPQAAVAQALAAVAG